MAEATLIVLADRRSARRVRQHLDTKVKLAEASAGSVAMNADVRAARQTGTERGP